MASDAGRVHELAHRLRRKLGYENPTPLMRELVLRGVEHLELMPAEAVALGGADISEIANEGGSVTIRPDDPARGEQFDAYIAGLRTGWKSCMVRALRDWAAEEYVL